jgi:hypothetical protein
MLTFVVADGDDEGERGAEGHDAGDGRRPGSLAVLDLHPAVDVVAAEVELDDVEVGDHHRRLGGRFLVVVEPLAAQPLRLVPNLEQIPVVLDHHRVLVELAVQVGLGAAPAVRDPEREVRPRVVRAARAAPARRHVHAPRVAVLTLRVQTKIIN